MLKLSRLARRASALALALVCCSPVAASAATITAHGGELHATFSYGGSFPIATHPLLSISRSGRLVFRRVVTSSICENRCWPSIFVGGSSLRVVSLNAAGPDVVVSLYSGGAHCCFVDEVYAPAGSSYVKSQYDFGDPGARITVLRHGEFPVFLSADDSFAYAFTDYAASGLPLKVLAFRHGHFVNVTRQYPTQIAHDASQWWSAFAAQKSSHYSDSVGVFAAWAADEYLLGHASHVKAVALAQARAGHLNSALSPINPSGLRYVSQLERFLSREGYGR